MSQAYPLVKSFRRQNLCRYALGGNWGSRRSRGPLVRYEDELDGIDNNYYADENFRNATCSWQEESSMFSEGIQAPFPELYDSHNDNKAVICDSYEFSRSAWSTKPRRCTVLWPAVPRKRWCFISCSDLVFELFPLKAAPHFNPLSYYVLDISLKTTRSLGISYPLLKIYLNTGMSPSSMEQLEVRLNGHAAMAPLLKHRVHVSACGPPQCLNASPHK